MPTITFRWQVTMVILSVLATVAQGANAPPPAAQSATPSDAKPFKPEELEQLVAPVALYPDSLLAQVLMASTYPLEIVQAERWRAANKDLKGDALAAELNKQDWDPSVKSLLDFPQVLEMMNKQLDWTTKLGDAFIADQAALMAAAQRLRAKAQKEGNLKDTPEQKVVIEQAPTQSVVVQGAAAPPPQIITIESKSPDVVYVPTYNPSVVYGAWPYPAYPPPAPYYPPGYVASSVLSFGAGVAVGAAWGHAWGDCNWGHGEVDIDTNRNVNRNSSINRESYRANMESRRTNVQGSRNTFQHDPSHRKGVSYRDQASAKRVGQLPANANAAKARDNFRGRAETGRQDIARGGADSMRGGAGNRGAAATPLPANRGGDAARGGGGRGADAGRGGAGNRGASASPQPANRAGGGANRGASPSQQPANRGGAFSGADRGGTAARSNSSRGQASRSASPSASRSGGSANRGGGGASRGGGGGGARGGGGRGGGGRR